MDLRTIPTSTDTITVNSLEGSSPHHQVIIQSYLDLPRNFEFSQVYRYISGLPAQMVAGYQTVDARVAWHPNKHFEFSVTGQNTSFSPIIPDAWSGIRSRLVGIKRNVFATLTWRE